MRILNLANIYILLLAIVQSIGDYYSKKYSLLDNRHKYYLLFIAIISYIGVIFLSIKSYQHFNLIYVIGIWNASSIIFGALISYFILKEDTRIADYLGLFVIFSGMMIIYLF